MATEPQDHQSAEFTYEFLSGEKIVLPRFKSVMTFGRARKLRKLDEAEQMFTLIEEICDDDMLEALDAMEPDETTAFFEAWQADSGVTTGESSA